MNTLQVTRRAGPSSRCSQALGHQLEQTPSRRLYLADPAQVAPLGAYVLREGCKRRTDRLTRRPASALFTFHLNNWCSTSSTTQHEQYVLTVLPNWETGEAHQDARDEPTWTPCFFVLVCRQRFEDRITSRLESGLAAISSMLILLGTSWQRPEGRVQNAVQSLEARVQGSDYRVEPCAQLQQLNWA